MKVLTEIKQNTSKSRLYFPNLDGLRFFAFLLVFFTHFAIPDFTINATPINALYDRGWMGVELFFVLSSFLLTSLLVKEFKIKNEISVGKYFMRRILRIWPLYFLYILMVIIAFGLPHEAGRFIGSITFTDNIMSSLLGFNESMAYVSHLWTISLEEQFYLILPFVIPFLVKLNKKTLLYIGLGVWGMLILTRLSAVLLNMPHPFIWTSPISGDAFLFGMLAALGAFDGLFSKINPYIKMLIGISLLVFSMYLPNVTVIGYGQLPLYSVIAIGFLFIMQGANSNTVVFNKILGNKPIKYLGKISFGLYIYHEIVIGTLTKWFYSWFKSINTINPGSDMLIWALCFLATLTVVILVSIASYEIYEKHFIRLKKRYTVILSRPEKSGVPAKSRVH